jgi:hypothetical protein
VLRTVPLFPLVVGSVSTEVESHLSCGEGQRCVLSTLDGSVVVVVAVFVANVLRVRWYGGADSVYAGYVTPIRPFMSREWSSGFVWYDMMKSPRLVPLVLSFLPDIVGLYNVGIVFYGTVCA